MHLINYNVKKGEKEFIHYLFYFDYIEERCSRKCGCWHSVILRDGGNRSTQAETTDLGQATTTLS